MAATSGSGFVGLHRISKAAASIETGLEPCMRSNWGLAFASEIMAKRLRTRFLASRRYRLPLLAQTKVPLNQRWELLAGSGVCVDFLLSDVFTTGTNKWDIYHEYRLKKPATALKRPCAEIGALLDRRMPKGGALHRVHLVAGMVNQPMG